MFLLDFNDSLIFSNIKEFREMQKAADKGCSDSQFIIAKSFLNDAVGFIGQNTWYGMEYLFKASLNVVDAKLLLAKIYSEGIRGADKVVILKDRNYAYNLIQSFIGSNCPDAEELLGDFNCNKDFLEIHGMDKEYAQIIAFLYYEKAGLAGSASAQYKQAMMHKNGHGTKKSIGLAHYMLEKSAQNGFAPAIKELKENSDIYI